MERKLTQWQVPFVERPYVVARYGWWGVPVLLFPTGGSPWYDNENFGLVGALAPMIEAGRIKVYSVDAPNKDVWTHAAAPVWHKAWVQVQYDAWLDRVLFPWIHADCEGGRAPVVVAGASLGAYQALNAFAKHPEHVFAGVGMSGTYSLDRRMGGFRNDDYYYNQPLLFLPWLGPSRQLTLLRQRFFQFGLGEGPGESPDYTWRAAEVLGRRGIPNHVEVWADGAHDWPTWQRMLPSFLDRMLPEVERRAA